MRRLAYARRFAQMGICGSVLASPGLAQASWSMPSGAGTAQVAAATLQNALQLAATCGTGSAKGVVLNWVASGSAYAEGYRIYRKINTGSFVALPDVVGRAIVTYDDSSAKNAAKGDTYAYTITAYVQNWTTSPSLPVSKSFSLTNGQCLGP